MLVGYVAFPFQPCARVETNRAYIFFISYRSINYFCHESDKLIIKVILLITYLLSSREGAFHSVNLLTNCGIVFFIKYAVCTMTFTSYYLIIIIKKGNNSNKRDQN